jgi:peptidyl-tRNA hydrolase, PTH1 family
MSEQIAAEQTPIHLVVGLGNPGDKYTGTRHNIGFQCLDIMLKRMGNPMPLAKFEGQLAKGSLGSVPVMLLWPLTFMNLSGRSVRQVVSFYKIPFNQIIVICDDLALPTGKLRIRKRGSSGGQKGLGDILQSLGTEEIARLRIGINPPPPGWDAADYVLGRFKAEERETINEALDKAANAIADWTSKGVDYCMNQYNKSD